MLSDPLTIKDSAGTDVVFNLTSSVTDPKTGAVVTKRADASRGPTEPRELIIKTSITGSGQSRVRRVAVQCADTQLSATGIPYTMTYQGSWVYPLNGEFATGDLDNAICITCDLFLTTASLAVDTAKRAALLQGQA
jgi:hypothetical protein